MLVLRVADRIWKEFKQLPSTAVTDNMLGCCLVSFNFLWAILSMSTVELLTCDTYRPVTIFWPCPEVVIISDKYCIHRRGA